MDPEATLAWERQHRPRAVFAAALAGVLQAIAIPVQASGLATPAHDDDLQLLTRLNHHTTTVLVGTALQVVGLIAAAYALWYLYKAVQARREGTRGPVGMEALVIAGPLVAAVTVIAAEIAQTLGVHNFFHGHGPFTVAVATNTLKHNANFVFGAYVAPVGALLFAVALVLISLNAMRVGLLTRFIGVLGILLGAFQVLPLLPPIIVAFFWFGALAFLFAGRWPQGLPAAWTTGTAVPWPTRQQMIEQREREDASTGRGGQGGQPPARAGGSRWPSRRDPQPEPEPEREPQPAALAAGRNPSASKKRKRKRKR